MKNVLLTAENNLSKMSKVKFIGGTPRKTKFTYSIISHCIDDKLSEFDDEIKNKASETIFKILKSGYFLRILPG